MIEKTVKIIMHEDYEFNGDIVLFKGENIPAILYEDSDFFTVVADKKISNRSKNLNVGDKFWVHFSHGFMKYSDGIHKIKYMAADGREFDSEKECDRYDNDLKKEYFDQIDQEEKNLWYKAFMWLIFMSLFLAISSIIVFAIGKTDEGVLLMSLALLSSISSSIINFSKL